MKNYTVKFIILVSLVLLVSCAQKTVAPVVNDISGGNSNNSRPDWVDKPPYLDSGTLYFVAVSDPYVSERVARERILMGGAHQVSSFLSSMFMAKTRQVEIVGEVMKKDQSIAPALAEIASQKFMTSNLLSEVYPSDFYTEELADGFKLYALFRLSNRGTLQDNWSKAMGSAAHIFSEKAATAETRAIQHKMKMAEEIFKKEAEIGFGENIKNPESEE